MYKYLSFCCIIILAFFACNRNPAGKQYKKSTGSIITYPCAVIVSPTLHQIDSLKASGDSTDFYTGADDYVYYTSTAQHYLDSVKCKTVNRESKGSITFKTSSGKVYKIKLSDLYWAVILFNGKSQPVKADITDITDDYKSYMKR